MWKTLDLSKSFEDHFHEVEINPYMVDTEDIVEADDESFEDSDDELFGTKSDSSSITSKSSDIHMEDVTKATSCIDLTDVDNTEENKKTSRWSI